MQLIATGFYRFLNILKKRQPATATGFESGQLQPMVWLQLVVFGPVSVIFLVLATGSLNTIDYNETWAGVMRLESVQITAAVAAKLDLKLWQIDFISIPE